jgi:hypothetical protein
MNDVDKKELLGVEAVYCKFCGSDEVETFCKCNEALPEE